MMQQPMQTMTAAPVMSMPMPMSMPAPMPSMGVPVAAGMQAGPITTVMAPPVYMQEQVATAAAPQTYMAPTAAAQPMQYAAAAPMQYGAPQAPQMAPQVEVREKYVDVPQIEMREVEKQVIVPQIQERIVEIPQVQQHEVVKHVMVPQIQEVIKEVPRIEIQTVEKIVEVPQIQYQERIVEVPHIQTQEVVKHVPKMVVQEVVKEMKKVQIQSVEKIVEVPQVQYAERIVEVPDVQVQEVIKHVPRVEIQEVVKQVTRTKLQTVEKIVEVPQVQTVERIVEVPQIVEVPVQQQQPMQTMQGSMQSMMQPAMEYGAPQPMTMMAPQPAMEYVASQPMTMMAPQPVGTTMQQMPAATFTSTSTPMMMQEPVPSATFTTVGMPQATTLGQTLFVEVVRATGLHHMNHFTGDHPYVQCEIKHLNRHERTTKAATQPVTEGDTLNPFWGERLELQSWQPGEDLEFTVYDQGLIGAKTEGKVNLPSHMFYPNGFTGNLEISGLPGALLEIVIQPAGGTTIAAPTSMTSTGALAAPAATYSAPMTYSAGTPASGMTYSSNVAPPTMTYSAGTPTSAAAPVMMMGPSATYGAAPTAMPMQTYAAPTTAYSTPYSTVPPTINTTPAMPMQTYAAPQTVLPAQSYASAPAPTYMEPTTTYPTAGGQMFGSAGQSGTGAYKLAVSIMQAQNLKHLNHFTGDKPYVVCEVKHNSHHERKTKAQTKEVTIGDTSNPQWNECLELEPWHPGEKLDFTIYDKGLLGSRTEGKAELPGEMFFPNPNGWTGALPIEGHPEMMLQVGVQVLGPSAMSAA